MRCVCKHIALLHVDDKEDNSQNKTKRKLKEKKNPKIMTPKE